MVQRRHRIDKKPSPTTYHYRKLFGFAAGTVVLVLWLLYSTSSSDPDETTNEADVPAELVIVEVLNGTHVSGIAGQMSRFLMENDFDSLITGNTANQNIPETIIIERLKESSDRIFELTGIRNRTFARDSGSTTVTIVLGADYELFNPFKQ